MRDTGRPPFPEMAVPADDPEPARSPWSRDRRRHRYPDDWDDFPRRVGLANAYMLGWRPRGWDHRRSARRRLVAALLAVGVLAGVIVGLGWVVSRW